MPPGGDGFYYFSTYLLGLYAEYSFFDLIINGNVLCTVRLEQQETSGDFLQSACSAAIYAVQGIFGDFKLPHFLKYFLILHFPLLLLVHLFIDN